MSNIIEFPVERTRQTSDSLIRQLDILLKENHRIEKELAEQLDWTQVQFAELQKITLQ